MAEQPNLNRASNGVEVLLTSKEASQVLKIHPKVLERMARRGEVPALKVGKFWRYRAPIIAIEKGQERQNTLLAGVL